MYLLLMNEIKSQVKLIVDRVKSGRDVMYVMLVMSYGSAPIKGATSASLFRHLFVRIKIYIFIFLFTPYQIMKQKYLFIY